VLADEATLTAILSHHVVGEQLGPSAGNDYWRQWHFPWTAESGTHRLACRVTDGKGQTQSAARADPFPEGSSGIQTLIVTVR
jgi:hypothetical protein